MNEVKSKNPFASRFSGFFANAQNDKNYIATSRGFLEANHGPKKQC